MKKTSSLRRRFWKTGAIVVALAVSGLAGVHHGDWTAYGHDPGGTRFSPLNQINRKNVRNLQVAWTYDTGERGNFFETTPIVVANRMYFTTPEEQVVAISATTGKEIWRFDPHVQFAFHQRGVSYWPGDAQHAPRIVFASTDGNLYELDAETGKLIPTFGNSGVVDLKTGVATPALPNPRLGITSAPAIYKNVIILGPETQEGPSIGPSGDPRAFDAITGKEIWRFHTVPRPGEPGNASWGPGGWKNRAGPSAWGPITVDEARGLTFIPIGNPAGNMYGADRKGEDLYSDSVVCLNAETGKLVWYFQLVHHDIWDYDVSAPPALISVRKNGQTIPAVVALDKDGLMYILDELTGKPVFGVAERPVPRSDVPGEQSWPTQPFPVKPPPLAKLSIDAQELSTVTPDSAKFCRDLFAGMHNDGPFTPYGTTPTVVFPGTIGGSNWNGVSFDPHLGYIFANVSDVGAMGQMVPNNAASLPTSERGGRGGRGGRGPIGMTQGRGMAYVNKTAYARFRDQDHHPCNAPPWGELIAINANTGNIAWKSVLGEYPDLKEKGILHTGTPNLGGSIATAGGLVFVGATADHRFRAFDARTGEELWSAELDGYAIATPMTYMGANNKQYVVIADGSVGSFLGTFLPNITPVEGRLIAFDLGAAPAGAVPAGDQVTHLTVPPPAGMANLSTSTATNAAVNPLTILPPGEERNLVTHTCTSCHGLSTVTSQRRSGAQWITVINGMRSMGAAVSAQQITEIANYLTANLGNPVHINQASVSEMEDGLLLSTKDAHLIVQHREKWGPFKSLEDLEKVPGVNITKIEEQKRNIDF